MKCKVFYARGKEQLEKVVNDWLETHQVQIELTQFSTVMYEDSTTYALEHTLVLFYVPLYPLGERGSK